MFVNIVNFPLIKEGKDAEFREWFARSSGEFAKHPGFIRRRLLQQRGRGGYVGVVEHESFETFAAMHSSPTQAEAHRQVESLFDGNPSPLFFEVVLDSSVVAESEIRTP